MAMTMRCCICRDEHKADSRHFPAQVRIMAPFKRKDPNVARAFMTVYEPINLPVCRKCEHKAAKKQFIQKHGITPDKTGAKRIMEIIRDAMEGGKR